MRCGECRAARREAGRVLRGRDVTDVADVADVTDVTDVTDVSDKPL